MAVAVKICGLTRPEDARAAASAGADWLGINFWPGSKRFVGDAGLAREIAAAARAERDGVLVVGVFVNQPGREVARLDRAVPLDLVQLHGDETAADCAALGERAVKAIAVGSREDAERGTAHALELFPELKSRWDTTARSLSGGQQQMVVLAQALASSPSVLLVDELSLGLAPLVVKRLVPTLASVAAAGVGVLLIEQFAHVALGLANKAYILQGGRIRYDGSAQELRDDPELLHSAYLLRV